MLPPVLDYGGGCGVGEDDEMCDRTCVFSWQSSRERCTHTRGRMRNEMSTAKARSRPFSCVFPIGTDVFSNDHHSVSFARHHDFRQT